MNDSHLIEKAVFEVSFGSEQDALEQESHLGFLMKNSLLPVVDEVISEISETREGQIDALAVDLGRIEYIGFQDEMEKRLRIRLKQALEEKLPRTGGIAPSHRRSQQAQTEWDRLKNRLAEGIKQGTPEAIKDLWKTVLHEQPHLLKKMILDYGREVAVRRGLSQRFPDPMLEEMVDLIEPAARPFVHEMVVRPSLFRQVKDQPETATQVKPKLWEFTLTYLIVDRGSRFNKMTYLDSMVRQMAAHDNIAYGDLLHTLKEGLEMIETPNTVKDEMLDLLDTLSGKKEARQPEKEAAQHPLVSEAPYNDGDPPRSYDLYESLRQALLTGKTLSQPGLDPHQKDLIPMIDALTRSSPDQLLRLYREFQSQGWGAGKTNLSKLTGNTLYRLITAFLSLTPQTADAAPTEIMQAIEKISAQVSNKQRCFLKILESLIKNQPIDFEAILREDTALGKHVDPNERKKETTHSPAPEAPSAPPGNASLIRSYELYESLRLALFAGETLSQSGLDPHQKDLIPVIDALTHSSPDQLLRVYRELQSQGWDAGNINLSKLSADSLYRLITAFLSLTPQAADAAPTDIMQAIEKLAEEVRNKQRCFLKILESLIRNQIIDFEAILREDSAQAKGFDPHQNEIESAETSTSARLKNRLSAAIREGRPESIVAIWQDIVKNQPQLLREVLFRYGNDPAVLKKLSRHFPDAMLHDMITLITPSSIHFIDEIMAGAILSDRILFTPGGVLQSDAKARIKALFWEVTLTTLCATEHSTFNKKNYLSKLIRELAISCNVRYRDLLFSFIEAVDPRSSSKGIKNAFAQLLTELAGEFSKDIQKTVPDKTENTGDSTASARDPRPETGLKEYLLSGRTRSNEDRVRLTKTIDHMLAQNPAQLSEILAQFFENRGSFERLADLLPEPLLARLLLLLHPTLFERILRTADFISQACYLDEIDILPDRMRRLKWAFIFRSLFEHGRRFHPATFIDFFTRHLASAAQSPDVNRFRILLGQQLARNILPATRQRILEIISVLSQLSETEVSVGTDIQKTTSVDAVSDAEIEQPEEVDEEIFISNAGQVLAAPYLQRLFEHLHLTETATFRDRETAERAVHLLQFMVNESPRTPEHQLVLNKILCGVKTGIPIAREIRITGEEKTVIEGLLKGMIENWKQIGNTSVQGFRESFLQREGVLRLKDDAWHLTVVPKPFDMLLDQIPWSFSPVKLPWMDRILYVKWR